MLLAAALGLVVGVLNPDPVALDLALVEPELPLGGLVLTVFALGVVAGLLVFWVMFDLPARLSRRGRERRKDKAAGLPARND